MAIVYKTNTVALNSTSKKIEELCSPVKLQSKQVDVLLSDVETKVEPDEGFDGFYEVIITHSPIESNTPFNVTSNGQYIIHPSEGFDATTGVNLDVQVPIYCYWYKPQPYALNKVSEIRSFYAKAGVSVSLEYVQDILNSQSKADSSILLLTSKEPIDFTFSECDVEVEELKEFTPYVDSTEKGLDVFYEESTAYCYAAAGRKKGGVVYLTPEAFKIPKQVKTQTISENGSYNITADSGLLSEVQLTVDVSSSSEILDINNPYVNLAYNTNVTQEVIDSLSGWDELTDGSYKLANSKLKDGNYSVTLDLPNVEDISNMFTGPISGFNLKFTDRSFKKVTKGSTAFQTDYGYSYQGEALPIDLTNVVFESLQNGSNVFAECTNKIRVAENCFPNTATVSSMFKNSAVEGVIYLPKALNCDQICWNIRSKAVVLNIPKVTSLIEGFRAYDISPISSITIYNEDNYTGKLDLTQCFYGQVNLRTLNITTASGIYASNETSTFRNCISLADFNVNKIKSSFSFTSCTSLTQDSVNNIMSALVEGVTNQSITFASTQFAYLTEEQIAEATSKGWTIKQA